MIIVNGKFRRWGRLPAQVTIPALFMVVVLLIMYIYLFPAFDGPISSFCETGDVLICALLRFAEFIIPIVILWSFWNYAMPRYQYIPPVR